MPYTFEEYTTPPRKRRKAVAPATVPVGSGPHGLSARPQDTAAAGAAAMPPRVASPARVGPATPSVAQTVTRLLRDENAPLDARASIQPLVESIAAHDRAPFADFVDAVDEAGGLPPRRLKDALPILMRVAPSERAGFVEDVARVFSVMRWPHGRRPEAGMLLDALHNLAALSGPDRTRAVEVGLDHSSSPEELHCLLGHLTALGSTESRQRFARCLDTLRPSLDVFGGLGNVAGALASLGVERAEQAVGCLEQHFPTLIPHPRTAELLEALGRIGHREALGAFVRQVQTLEQMRTQGQGGDAWPDDLCASILSVSRLPPNDREAVVDELRRSANGYRGEALSRVIDHYLTWKASIERFAFEPQDRAVRLAGMERVASSLLRSTDASPVLVRWLAKLPNEALHELQHTLGLTAAVAPDEPLDRALIKSALRVTPRLDAAVDTARPDAIWAGCIERIVDQQELSPLWKTVPLRLLVPYRAQVFSGLETRHAHCLDRKAFDINNAEHRMVDALLALRNPHLTKFLSVDRHADFCLDDVQKVQNDKQLRELFEREAERIHGFEARCLAYEADLFDRTMLQPARQRAKELDVPLILWLNVTSGATAGTPLALSKLQEQGVEVVAAKQPSTQQASETAPLDANAVPPDVLARFFGESKAPLVLVCDFSAHERYPRSFQRFRNLAAVINDAWGRPAYETWRQSGVPGASFTPENPQQQALVEKARALAATHAAPARGLELHYTTTTGKPLGTLHGEAASAFSWQRLNGPGFVCAQTALSHDELEVLARDGDVNAARLVREARELGVRHKRGYFDDNDQAQIPLPFPSKRGNFKLNPPVHRKARDAFKQLLR